MIDTIIQVNAIEVMKTMPDKSINCIITSPPYWGLRDYGIEPIIWDGDPECQHNWQQNITEHDNLRPSKVSENTQVGSNKELGFRTGKNTNNAFCSLCGAWKGSLGLEPTFQLYIQHLIQIFDECKRILRDDGTLWVNIGDTYASGTRDNGNGYDSTKWEKSKEGQNCKGWHIQPNRRLKNYQPKCLCDIPFRFSIAMIDSGWIKRNTLIWHKPNCMPASAKDRFTIDFEYVFVFVKKGKYYFEQQFEPMAESTLPRMSRGVSETNKWVNGADGQTKHTMSQPRVNVRKMAGTKYGGDGSGLHEHSGYFDKDGTPRFYPQGRNKRCVWSIPTKSFSEAHFATFPETLIEPMIKAGCPEFVCKKCGKAREKVFESHADKREEEWHDEKYGESDRDSKRLGRMQPSKSVYNTSTFEGYTDCGCNAGFYGGIVYDPFMGAGTVAVVAKKLGRHWLGSELNPEYIEMANKRIERTARQLKLF